jgi:hypothetical protein
MLQQPNVRVFYQADQGGKLGSTGEPRIDNQGLPFATSLAELVPISREEGVCNQVLFGDPTADQDPVIDSRSKGTPAEHELITLVVEESFAEDAQTNEPQ